MNEPSVRQNPPGRTLAAVTIFLSAFLLFAIQPLIAKMILPWFGGSASVWIACLLFFQTALLAGYAYAHLLTQRIPVRLHWMIHAFFLAASLLILPIIPSEGWKAADADQPLLLILELLSATVGPPFVLMAATGPLTQAWLSLRIADPKDGPSIYRLYALSNFGSLLALLSYPVLIEPWLPTRAQAQIWSGVYVVFAVCIAVLGWRHRADCLPGPTPNVEASGAVSIGDRLVWFALAAVPSALLLAVTNQMLRNVAPIPLLWVIPLALYLLSLIICFDHSRWFYRPLWYGLLPFAVGAMTLMTAKPFLASYALQLAVYASAFFVCCMVSHGDPPCHRVLSDRGRRRCRRRAPDRRRGARDIRL